MLLTTGRIKKKGSEKRSVQSARVRIIADEYGAERESQSAAAAVGRMQVDRSGCQPHFALGCRFGKEKSST